MDVDLEIYRLGTACEQRTIRACEIKRHGRQEDGVLLVLVRAHPPRRGRGVLERGDIAFQRARRCFERDMPGVGEEMELMRRAGRGVHGVARTPFMGPGRGVVGRVVGRGVVLGKGRRGR
jgi:hypothetical protein